MTDHPRFAAVYDRMLAGVEDAGLRARRREVLSRATGRVLEIGAGTGLNLVHYTRADSLTVLEPDGAMRARLQVRLADCPASVEVVAAGIDDADLPEASFDTVVSTLVLCTVPDLEAAAARIRALLAPGGRLLFIEHTAAPGGWGFLQRLVDPVWTHLAGGCHLQRDPVRALRRAGLLVADYERGKPGMLPGLIDTLVYGTATEHRAPPLAPPGAYPRPRPGARTDRPGRALASGSRW